MLSPRCLATVDRTSPGIQSNCRWSGVTARAKFGDSSPISTTIHSKELITKQLGQISGATGRTRPVPILLGRTHWSSTTSGTQDSVEIREESQLFRAGSLAGGWPPCPALAVFGVDVLVEFG